MNNSGPATANTNPGMEGVTPTGGDNEDQKPADPRGPAPLSTMSEEEQHGALTAGSEAYGHFPKDPGKYSDNTYTRKDDEENMRMEY